MVTCLCMLIFNLVLLVLVEYFLVFFYIEYVHCIFYGIDVKL
jgi:hypothetical protein